MLRVALSNFNSGVPASTMPYVTRLMKVYEKVSSRHRALYLQNGVVVDMAGETEVLLLT